MVEDIDLPDWRKRRAELERRFVASGKRYDYEAVPPETYAAFRNAFVKGRFFNDQFRDRFGHRLIAEA
ncbi:KTSC domain-containing protein [Mesorhizobium sp. M1322]